MRERVINGLQIEDILDNYNKAYLAKRVKIYCYQFESHKLIQTGLPSEVKKVIDATIEVRGIKEKGLTKLGDRLYEYCKG